MMMMKIWMGWHLGSSIQASPIYKHIRGSIVGTYIKAMNIKAAVYVSIKDPKEITVIKESLGALF